MNGSAYDRFASTEDFEELINISEPCPACGLATVHELVALNEILECEHCAADLVIACAPDAPEKRDRSFNTPVALRRVDGPATP